MNCHLTAVDGNVRVPDLRKDARSALRRNLDSIILTPVTGRGIPTLDI